MNLAFSFGEAARVICCRSDEVAMWSTSSVSAGMRTATRKMCPTAERSLIHALLILSRNFLDLFWTPVAGRWCG